MAGRPTLSGVRVLVAEDHVDTADLMRTVLQGQGAIVRMVDSISAALSALADSPVDVLVSDIGMPDGTGYELMARVQERERAAGRRRAAGGGGHGLRRRRRSRAGSGRGVPGLGAEAHRSRAPRRGGGPRRAGPLRPPLSAGFPRADP